jgi:hypothetical protein
MRPVRSSKFLDPVLTTGPVGTLAMLGTKYPWSDLAIAIVVDGARSIGSSIGRGGVVWFGEKWYGTGSSLG